MKFLYQLGINLAAFLLPFSRFFSPKMKLFVDGRKQSFAVLENKIDKNQEFIWFHVASLGEYEQGLPVMEEIKTKYPEYKLLLTFFSPSGFEIRKNNKVADYTIYLPLDTTQNVKRFLDIVQPKMVFFIKYEFWPNYLYELKNRNIPTYLISGIFRKNQLFFKWYGGFYRKALQSFNHFFVQNDASAQLLKSINFNNSIVNGDTRFDRVAQIVERAQPLNFIAEFKNNTTTIVIGSSWIDDETIYLPYLYNSKNIKFIIAPHNIKEEEITRLISKIDKKTVRYTNYKTEDLKDADVFIIDTIGILTQIYAYADIAYVGGAFKTGLHNILEPATYGTPVVIGPKFSKFQEAKDLVALGSCLVVNNTEELVLTFNRLISDLNYRKELGQKNREFVLKNKNATKVIMDFVERTQNL
ncbi:3-deoxy-D-manno-octulosonic-acid transferase [Paenimyroides ummariense]|uniref:3-deoxy-D-manno-octulosonic acid transferase n=1 Tax=Paenimyroides ummariense TaxID=913024 RepID=A0A1I5C380_9FLAO|nr:glycosyltransferase N-terminal domain-containing protein [Paenimyroides ummariense]SFN81262.1 3-deoxy-D-manno-octulosonic-acid transferase [Paenimyroides ummariense]